MRLKSITGDSVRRIYHFVRLRSDGAELDSLLISCDGALRIQRLEIVGNSEGSCAMDGTGNVLHCSVWESEASASAVSDWSKHYTSRVGLREGNKSDARTILRAMSAVVTDTYLKHILREFETDRLPITFNADFYRVFEAQQSPEPAPVTALPEKIAKPSMISHAFKYLAARRILIAAIGATIVGVFSICTFLYRRPPELPAKSALILEMESVPLLSVATRVDKDLDSIIAIEARGAGAPDSTPPKSEITSFDKQYILNNDKPTLEKANRLREYFENHFFATTPLLASAPALRIFDFLREQLQAESYASYLLYLIRRHPGTEMAIEAHFLYSDILADQAFIARTLYDNPNISDRCAMDNFSYESYPNETIFVCDTYKKYQNLLGGNRAFRDEAYRRFQLSIFEHAEAQNDKRYRIDDITAKIKAYKSGTATQPKSRLEMRER